MNASYEWLRAFVPVNATPAQLRDLFTAHTATVEELVPLRADLAPIVIARVKEAGRHPDSDHLWVTQVDAGGPETLEVICGAPNVTVGALYPFAPVGTTMPNGIKIERRKIRGIYSNGMLCSARELNLGEDQAGIMELDVAATPGTPFLAAVPMGDTRLVLDVGANRPDLLSHLGLARELAAISGKQWRLPEIPNLGPEIPKPAQVSAKGTTGGIEVRVSAESRARRYLGAVIRGVDVGPSPEWLIRRLDAVGVRSISNVVDATNYVLHELGQPVHAFDLAKLRGAVAVRRASPGETLVTLDGESRKLHADVVVIADDRGAQAVAGVMGGRESEVTQNSRDLFIEVASFDPKLTRSARRSLGLNTDASYRFERGVDPALAPAALDRVVRLIISLAGGRVDGAPVDVRGTWPEPATLTLRAKRTEQVLGERVPMDQARRYLEGAGFVVHSSSESELRATVPTWRVDVSGEIDLVEEVARFHGYDRFPDEIRPFRPTTTFDDPLWTVANRVRDALVGLGLFETRPMPFVHATEDTYVRVRNPLSENEAFLRQSVLETLARRAEFNLSHRSGDLRLFEIGSAFLRNSAAMPREQLRLGALIMGRRHPPHFTEPRPPMIDMWDAKELAAVAASAAYAGRQVELVPAAKAGDVLWHVRVGDRTLGNVTRVALDAPVWSSPAYGVELVLGEMETQPAAPRGGHSYIEGGAHLTVAVSRYRALPTMPPAEFDLALLVPIGTTRSDVENVIRNSAGELLESLDLFDEYTGEGVPQDHRSLAWRLTFRHPERTLRDKEIEGRRNKILGALEQELHVRKR
ncbi:MAG TPA: phenylalanine--tRNA ligase subunit beta [Gemmatimonadaceae bacterium]|nr:phenylalanine--tRNA ligase subunit beta [Gemmatimonadaceae bacterium]